MQCPSSLTQPWSIVVYTDEASTGALLKIDNTRKAYLWYWQFAEFGPEVLSREDAWFIGGVIRTKKVAKVQGGLSAVFKKWIERFFNTDCM